MTAKKSVSIFFPFRSFHNQRFSVFTLLYLLLPLMFNFICFKYFPYITEFWSIVVEFFLSKLGVDSTLLQTKYIVFGYDFLIPHIDMMADDPPNAITWWIILFLSILLLLSTYYMQEKFTPFIYLLRTFVFVLWFSLLFFAIFPTHFPYNISIYTKTGFLQIVSIIFGIPWIYCFTYYLIGFRYLKKIAITMVTIIYFIVVAPFQYLTNAYLINLVSVLLMPALYIYTGLLINIFATIAFFAYGVSLEQSYPKFKK